MESPPEEPKNPELPTIIKPNIANPHPAKCLFYMTILTKILEKIAVVMMDAPLNITYVDPAIKLKPIYCRIDERVSDAAGIRKIMGVCGFLPS